MENEGESYREGWIHVSGVGNGRQIMTVFIEVSCMSQTMFTIHKKEHFALEQRNFKAI